MIKTMTLSAVALAASIGFASTASAFTCNNTVEIVDGEFVYTSSVCTGQAPASQAILDSMSYSANNPGNDDQQVDEVETVTVVTASGEVVEVTLTRLEKLQKRYDRLGNRITNLNDKIKDAKGSNKQKLKNLRNDLKAERRNVQRRINRHSND